MSLAAHDTPPGRHPYYDRGCAFGRWIDTLPPSEHAAITAWLPADSGWTHSAIAAKIRDDDDYPGVEFPELMISRHRRGGCRCAR